MLAALKRGMARLKQLPGVRTAVAVQERYGRDDAGLLASAITYSAFLSLFPLLLLGLSLAGFVLTDLDARARFIEQLASAVPGLRTLLGDTLDALVRDREATGLLGLAGLTWSGLGIVRASGVALTKIFRIDRYRNPIRTMGWALGSLVTLGLLSITTVAFSWGIANASARGAAGIVVVTGGAALGVALDVALMVVAYRLLTQRRGPALRALLPGALFAGVGWSALKLIGAWYATRQLQGAQAVYGTFAAAVGLLVMLSLGARLFLYGAEISMVVTSGEPARTTERPRRAA